MKEEKLVRYMEVANDLNLIMVSDSAGVVYWKPNGLKLYENLKNYIRSKHEESNYLEVKSPSLVNNKLFIQSGHMEKYKDHIFMIDGDSSYSLRPMSCPNHILIYASEKRSYKDLPLPLFEFGEVFRNEDSGSLQVLFRQRQFCQDDSHVFVSKDNLIESLSNYIKMSKDVYNDLGFEKIKYAISLRPEKRFGDDDVWSQAENSLRDACKLNNVEYEEIPNGGAFYGPKLELQVQDKLNRWWQLGVIQLDYILPERFDLKYINKDNKEERPIILHHAVLGSLERMIGILLESFGKDLPEFIHPFHSVVISVSEKSKEYSKLISKKHNYILDNSDEPLGKKLENWRKKGAVKIYVVGEKEYEEYKLNGKMYAMENYKGEKNKVEL